MRRCIQTAAYLGYRGCGTHRRACALALAGASLIAGWAVQKPPLETKDSAGNPVQANSVRAFAPGVRIDWKHQIVEVDARVVLRQGPLELLACSPQTREHESIFVVTARPIHVFQAMGLIGLEAGRPVRYDEPADRLLPAQGEPLDIRIRWEEKLGRHTVSARKLLLTLPGGRPPESLHWVFAGSRRMGEGGFGADLDGTVICVVDFDTALISLRDLHSADNELLWLAANPDAIPPVGTLCTLLIRGAGKGRISYEVAVRADGTLRLQGTSVSVRNILERCRRHKEETKRAFTIVLKPEPDTPDPSVQAVIEALVGGGLDRRSIEVSRSAPSK